MLTATQVQALKPADKVKRYTDRDGLMIEVTPSGSKSWIQRITVDGKRKSVGLGSYPAISLAVARRRALDNKELVADGKQPLSSKDFKRGPKGEKREESLSRPVKRRRAPILYALKSAIYRVRAYLKKNGHAIADSERATEQFAVVPILDALGWSVYSPDDVIPQFRIEKGEYIDALRVDFALMVDTAPVAFIEVKRFGKKLSPACEKQILKYLSSLSAGYGVLTNGETWVIYQKLESVEKLESVNLRDNPESAVISLAKHLGKSNLSPRK